MRVPFQMAGEQPLARGSGAVPLIGAPSEQQFPRIRVPVADTADPNALAAPSKILGSALERATATVGQLWAVQTRAQERLEAAGLVNAFTIESQKIEPKLRNEGVEPQNWNTRYIDESTKLWRKLASEGWDQPQISADGTPVTGEDGKPVSTKMRATTRNSNGLAAIEIQRVIAHNAIQVQNHATKYLADRTEAQLATMINKELTALAETPVEARDVAMISANLRLDGFVRDQSRYLDLSKAAEKIGKFKVDATMGTIEQNLIDRMSAAKTDAEAVSAYMQTLRGELPDTIKPMYDSLPAEAKKKIISDANTIAQQQMSFRRSAQEQLDRTQKIELHSAQLSYLEADNEAQRTVAKQKIIAIVKRSPNADLPAVIGFFGKIDEAGYGPITSNPDELLRLHSAISTGGISDPNAVLDLKTISASDKKDMIAMMRSRQDTNYQRGLAVAKGRLELPTGLVTTLDPNNSVHRLLGRVTAEYAANFDLDKTQNAIALGERIADKFKAESQNAKIENRLDGETLLSKYGSTGGPTSFENMSARYQELLKKKDVQKAEAYLHEWVPKLKTAYQMMGQPIPDIDLRTGRARQ